MMAIHTFKIQAMCPVNGDTDYYECEVVLDRIVDCEQLLADAAEYRQQAIYQEDLTNTLAERWQATVTTRGHHVGGQVGTVARSFPRSKVTLRAKEKPE